ncbi:YckD family protein [Dethiobacter alkaliphilus]|uniref:YckD family protein n=1 Tax=Dethiobacter alkaliphilus TaxID=427926 RepID=UPI002226221B|nr:YckD family protein [Dethiobacter alkaliphilus]MCW3489244.1 YckD family protein [Dethiobacter alkaliphilus]
MNKGLLVALIFVLVLAMAVPVLALTESQARELETLYEQENQIRQQIVDKQEEAGLVDAETATSLRERLANMWEYRKQQFAEGNYLQGFGFGGAPCHGGGTGNGMMGGSGRMMW